MMTFPSIRKAAGNDIPDEILLQLLGTGYSRDDLEQALADWLSVSVTDPRISIARMNLVGGLRSWGYVVSGGRHGGDLYRIESWSKKTESTPVSEWVGPARDAVEWVHGLVPLTEEMWPLVRSWLSLRSPDEVLHENCWLYPWAYERARGDAWYFSEGSNAALIIQRFVNQPKFKIFSLFGSADWLADLAKQISIGSTRHVQIVHVTGDQTIELKKIDRNGSTAQREEAIYDLVDIGEHPDKYLNKRAMTTFRAREKDTTFYECSSVEEQQYVIKTWQTLNEHRHRQLAISRDFIAATIDYPLKITFGGQREGAPVIHHLFDPLANAPVVVSLINEKALNYKQFSDGTTVPGGTYGLSDFNQIEACRLLAAKGFRFIQSGGIDGGGVGLPDKKKKYATAFARSFTFHTSFRISPYVQKGE